MAVGLLFVGVAALHEGSSAERAELGRPYQGLGLLFTFGTLYVLSFRYAWTGSPDPGAEGFRLASPLGVRLLILTVGAAGIWGYMLWRTRREPPARQWEALAMVGLVAVPWVLAVFGAGMVAPEEIFYPPAAIVFNLLLFGLCLGVVALGYAERRPNLVTVGFWFFGVQLLTRYFDIFGKLMHTSLVFIGAGLLLLVGGGLLERARRQLVRQITPEGG
jgi:uncharacterized membrane protein